MMQPDPPLNEANSPQAVPATPGSKARVKRARTGCLKCRLRRRKCDEGKPRCQRCVDSDSACRYPSGLTFLDKNVLTVSSPSNPANSSSLAYRRLQFVDQHSKRSQPKKQTCSVAASPVARRVVPGPPLPSQERSPSPKLPPGLWTSSVLSSSSDLPTGNNDERLAWAAVAPEPAVANSLQELPFGELEGLVGVTPSDDYETALHVLLSLGGTDGPHLSRDTVPSRSHAGDVGTWATDNSPVINHVQVSEQPRVLNCSPSSGSQPPEASTDPVADQAVRECHLRLLRHYRYEVSPWLDMCDLDQTFGLFVPRMATESDMILQALLQLSAAALDADADTTQLHTPLLFGPSQISNECSPSSEIIAQTLMFVRDFFTTSTTPWQSPLVHFTTASAWDRLRALGPRMGRCITFLLLRLDLAAALTTDQAPSARQPAVESLLHWKPCSWEEDVFYEASKPFLLCARLLSFCSAEPTPSSPAFLTPWRAVAEELNAWYLNRSQEFQAMAELEHDSDNEKRLFPAILFSSGAAIFANQLYHTAMLLFLQRKPRTTAALLGIRPGSSRLLSPLWHVHRICGTALHNDRRECWDPCLVASLHFAARAITYEPQQREILGAFKAIESLTSWDMGYFVTDLHARWGLAPK